MSESSGGEISRYYYIKKCLPETQDKSRDRLERLAGHEVIEAAIAYCKAWKLPLDDEYPLEGCGCDRCRTARDLWAAVERLPF